MLPPARARGSPRDRASWSAAGPNGLAAAIRLAEAGQPVHRARGGRPSRRRGPDRGADASGLPPRHVLLGLSGGRRVAGVRADAAGAPRPATGCIRRLLRAPAARRPRGRAVPRRRPDRRRASTPCTPATATAWRAFVAPMLDAFDGGPRDDARRLPADRRAAAAARRAGPLRRGTVRGAAARLGRADSGAGCSAAPARARGCTAPPATATCRRRRGQRDRGVYLNLLGHAVGWPSPTRRRRSA